MGEEPVGDGPKLQSRGALIVVEGLDRAGKSTQCELLLQRLQREGYKVKHMRFPDRTTQTGKMIDAYLKGTTQLDDHAIHLLFSANRWEAASQIEDDVANGVTLIVDRYSYSGAVYSAAKDNPTLSLNWAWQPEIGLPKPDVWLFLNLSQEEAARRGGYGTERYESDKLQARVRKLYLDLVSAEQPEDICVIDASRSIELVATDIHTKVKETIDGVGSMGPLRKLEALNAFR